jgi:hypothetical protein
MEQILSLSAIRARKADLNRTILDVQAQLADLDVAERIVRRFGESKGDQRPDTTAMNDLLATVAPEVATPKPSANRPERGLTTKALIQSVLRQSQNPWMSAIEIQVRASFIKGQDVPMATISPTLSNMKNDGLIVRSGFHVALADRLNENEPLNGTPASGSEAGTDANPFLNPVNS